MPLPLILIAPGLLGRSKEALAQSRSLATLATISASPQVHEDGLAAALLSALHAPATPVAPLAAEGAGVDVGSQSVLVADPVLLAADRDSVVLLARTEDLREEELAMLLETLNRHFADDGIRFVAPKPDAWFMLMQQPVQVRFASTDVVQGRGIFAFLPQGEAGRNWRRRQNEIQMLLHDHPVNVARERGGKTPVTGIWLWGGGTHAQIDRLPRIVAFSEPCRFANLLAGIARKGGGAFASIKRDDALQNILRRVNEQSPSDAPIVVAIDSIGSEEALMAFESRWLQPAVRLLLDGSIRSLQLLANGEGVAAEWRATRPSWWQRLIPRARAFTPPGIAIT